MLTNLDEYPIHQVAEPMRHVGSSDRNFYDRYYFNGFDKTGECMFICGIGVYPNLGVSDAFLLVVCDGQHHVVRASCELEHVDRLKPGVGPLRVEVVEALRRVRFVCEPNEWGIALDAVWTGAHEAFEEPRHYIREHGRVIFDTTRFAQTGGWDGTLDVGDRHFSLTSDTWWGSRDRSWGIRPVGESEPQGIRGKNPFHWVWVYTPIRFDDHSVVIIMQERQDGSRVIEEAVRVWPESSGRAPEFFHHPRHELDFLPGTRFTPGGHMLMDDDAGNTIDIAVEVLLPVYVGVGTGYGYDTDWRHGMWQGAEPVVQHFHLDLNSPEGKARLFGLVDASAKFTYSDDRGTHVGFGLYETMIMGPYERYGFVDVFDGYRNPADRD